MPQIPILPADVALLKVAASVSKSLLIKGGSNIVTAKNATLQQPDCTVFMSGQLSFAPTKDLPIGDAIKLLSMIEAFDKPALDMDSSSNFLSVSNLREGKAKGAEHRMMLAGKAAIAPYVCKYDSLPCDNVKVVFTLSKEELGIIRSACRVSGLQFLEVKWDGSNLSMVAKPGIAKNTADQKRFDEADQFEMPLTVSQPPESDKSVAPFSMMIREQDMKMPLTCNSYTAYVCPESNIIKFDGDTTKFWVCSQE